MKTPAIAILCLLAVGCAGTGQAASVPEVKVNLAATIAKLRAPFDKVFRSIEPELKRQAGDVDARYLEGLAKLESGFSKSADWFGLAAVQTERERIRVGVELDVEKAPTLEGKLGEAFRIHEAARKKVRETFTRELAEPGRNCRVALADLQYRLIEAGDIESAVVVKDARHRFAAELFTWTGIQTSFQVFSNWCGTSLRRKKPAPGEVSSSTDLGLPS